MSPSCLGYASVTTTATYYAHLAPSHASKGAVAVLKEIAASRIKQDLRVKSATYRVARGRIEPPTRGFSVRSTAVRFRRITPEISPAVSLRL
jgi:hypothetical protein